MANYFLNDDGSLSKKAKKKKGNNYILQDDGKITLNSIEKEEKKEDIAPVKKRTWFNGASFNDGYDFGDVTKTILGTAGDIGTNLIKGSAQAGEGLAKLVVGGVAEVSDWVGQDKYADKLRNRLAGKDEEFNKRQEKFFVSSNLNKVSDAIDPYSVTGEKLDDLTSSVGTMVASASAPIPWWVTMGGSSAGHELENAYKSGATSGEAWGSALISGASEVLFEKLSGGISFGGRTLDEGAKRLLSNAITNKTASTLTRFGLDMAGEGAEEVLTEVASNIGRKLTYEDEKTLQEALFSEEALDNYLEAFIGGAVMGGGFNTIKLNNSLKTGRDYDTGLTQNEQRVVDKEVQNRIAEEEANGKKLTNKQKVQIEERVKEDLQRGNISTDLIESELGGEEYKSYKSILDKQAELDKINKTKKSEIETLGDEDTLRARKKALEEELSGVDINTLKSNLDSSMTNKIASDDFLKASYNEKAKKGVKFNADLSKYDAKQQKIVQKAIDSGILNDTNKTHDFVDMVAKISADKGIDFNFTNNENLKNSGFAVEGKTVNGFVNKNGIALNMDSNKALNRVVGHEITHVLEGTDLYTELQQVVKDYAATKGEYDTRLKELTELYKDVEDANIENELTADLVGDYLFTDTDFVKNLSTQKPNLFQKIYNEIKHLYKLATVGSKEARQLEKVKKVFEEAYRNSENNLPSDTKYMVTGKKGAKNLDKLTGTKDFTDNYNEALEMEKNNASKKEIREQTGWYKDVNNDWKFEISDKSTKIKTQPQKNATYKLEDLLDHNYLYKMYPDLKNRKVVFEQMETRIEDGKTYRKNGRVNKITGTIHLNNDIINNFEQIKSTLLHEIQHTIQAKEKFQNGTSASYGREKYDNNFGEMEARETSQRRNMTFEERIANPSFTSTYNGNNKNIITKDSKKWYDIFRGDSNEIVEENNQENKNNIRENSLDRLNEELDNSSFFNTKYSLTDNRGRTLTKEQQEYFKDSKAVDENGNLKVLYHGTPNEFNEFSYEFLGTNGTLLGKGFYLTDDTKVAEAYANKGENGKIMELYVDIKKPLKWGKTTISKQQFQKFVEAVNQATEGRLFADYSGEFSEKGSQQYNSTLNDILMDYEYGGDDIDLVSGILNSTGMNWGKGYEILKDTTGYDGIIVTTDVYDSGEGNVYIPFQSNQIKNVDNTNPTSDADIRYSLGNQDIAPSRNDVYGSDIKLQVEEAIAPLKEDIAKLQESLQPTTQQVETNLPTEADSNTENTGYAALTEADLPMVEQQNEEAFRNIDESNIPMEQEDTTPETEDEITTTRSLEDVRDFDEVGSRKVKAYQYENPEVKPYFQEMATYMLGDLENSIKGERSFNDQLYYDTAGEQGFYGTTRETTSDIAELLDSKYNYSYKDIRKGLEAIIKDHGAENIAVAKRIEFALDKRLREGYTDVSGYEIPANQDYIKLLQEKEISDYYSNIPIDENFVPVTNDLNTQTNKNIAPVRRNVDWDSVEDTSQGNQIAFNEEGKTVEVISELEKKQQRAYKKLGTKEDYISDKAFELYNEVKELKKGKKASYELGRVLDVGFANINQLTEGMTETQAKEYKNKIWRDITTALLNVKAKPLNTVNKKSTIEAVIRQNLNREYDSKKNDIANMKEEDLVTKTKKELRKELLIDENDFFINALDNAKNRSMALMNNTDTIRNTELVFGRDAGSYINEVIFQKEIDNEADSIAWQNKERDEIKALGIKARSKESAAVQKYGEKQYVNDVGELVAYGDKELISEFSDVETQEKIKRAAQVIRNKYDNYIDRANEVLTKLGFDAIPKRKDYMRHFQELNDVFSRYGIPFNAQNMTEHVLPTDINGLTENWSPQKNYFANTQRRTGVKTTYDAITGVDGYIGGIANLIYHTEDIQRGRAFEELIRETYGEDKGFENLDNLPDELKQARAEKIQDNHLSNYAAWLHEWTNNVAGKKHKIDRSVESLFGRKAFSFLDGARKQVGSNMIGFNLSSSLTNLIAPIQATAKTNKLAVLKGTADTIKNMFVKDDFMSKNKFLTSRMGTDMISKNAWQKIQDAGFIFMKGMDWFSSNQIVRSKYYELRAKGMSEQQAHAEAGQFAARILGDRTKGANAQLYNSKLVGLVTQFQLEVNNQLYSQFYDTYHESKEAARGNALKTAAGMTFTLGQLFAFTHLFGQTFEAIAGYNPTFDVIDMLKTAFGWGEDDDEEKTTSERLKSAADQLVDALPYVNILTGGGRIPVASGIPNLVGVATGGKDQYGNELTLEDELKKLLFLVPPTGGNQVKKTTQGLSMFDEDLPISGSYTDSGNLRFPVEDTIQNRIQASLFGQYASENAGYYFDNNLAPLKEKQIEEFIEMNIPYKEYREYRKDLAEVNKTKADKDEDGKAISGTAAGKKAYQIMNGDYSKKEKERLLEGLSSETYKITTSDLDKLNNNEELYKYYFKLTTKGKSDFINAIKNYGFDAETLYEANNVIKNIEDNYSKLNDNGKNLTKQKKQAIKNAISQYTTTKAQYDYLYHRIYKK